MHVVVVVFVAVAVAVFVKLAGTSDAHITWENAKMHHRLDTIKMLLAVLCQIVLIKKFDKYSSFCKWIGIKIEFSFNYQ